MVEKASIALVALGTEAMLNSYSSDSPLWLPLEKIARHWTVEWLVMTA